jgi:predicted transposase YdaD
MENETMGHDQTFKEFLREFLRDFLALFFPDVEARLDFGELQFLDAESFTSFPEGSSRTADVVAQVRTRTRAKELLLVHVEVEATRRVEFRERMFEYFALLWTKHRVPIIPIAVYLRGGRAPLKDEEFVLKLFGREQLRFRFPAVALARFEAREYVEKGSAVAATLAALMSRRRIRAPVPLRLSMVERVVQSGLDDARKFLLLHIIETYFVLAGVQRDEFDRALLQERYREVRKMQMTWMEKIEKKSRKEGREEGLKEGLLEGKRETLRRQLETKFGPLPEEMISRVRAVQSLPELDNYLDRVLVAASLEDMGLRG